MLVFESQFLTRNILVSLSPMNLCLIRGFFLIYSCVLIGSSRAYSYLGSSLKTAKDPFGLGQSFNSLQIPLQVSIMQSSGSVIDPLTATAKSLQDLLENGTSTGVDLVDLYLDQLEKHNRGGLKINAIISTAPRDLLTQRAMALDNERGQTGLRSLMHGIPVIIKVSSK